VSRRARPSQGGQTTVELALLLPLVLFVAFALVEVGLVAADQVRLWHAAREAARVAVVEPAPAEAEAAARRNGFESLDFSMTPDAVGRIQGDPLTVRLRYDRPGEVPLVGHLFEGVVLTAQATMRIEQP
jgi:Flp pilus assembly protein TadG